jgi:branched-chain amino acid transport system permease protein
MDASFAAVQLLTGLASASSLFIAASGLTLVFGVTRIVNFAHGSFYMLGAYVAVSLAPRLFEFHSSLPMFGLVVLLSALVVGLLGVAMEMLLLRRIYRAPELFQLLATFGVVLIVQDAVIRIWGPLDILGPRAPGLPRAVEIFGQRFPAYELLLIALGPVVLGLLWLLMRRTRFGVLIRAATQDREMVGALGVDQAKLFTATLFLGAFLAGLGGALQIPRSAANPAMDIGIISETFVVTVVGGMGSIPGAFLAAVVIGQLQAFGVLVFPKITLVLVFLLMAVVLVVRPWGFLGRPDAGLGARVAIEGVIGLRPLDRVGRMALLAALALAATLPLWGDAYLVKVGIETLCFALAAFSLNLLIGIGGMASFGHAAWFGLGAYAAGLLTVKAGLHMIPALIAAPLAAGLAAAAFGFFIVRLSGIYLAMLTLASAQLVYATLFQWVEVTGGDNGVVGVWPAPWAASRTAYYLMTFALVAAAIYALRRAIYAPFGYALRAARDSALRAQAIGVDVRRQRLLAFAIAGAATGLAGGLYAFAKGSIDPTLAAIPMSVDFLAMVLLGGVQTVFGAVVGAAALHLAKDIAMPLTDLWRATLGLVIVALVLAFPQGLLGGLADLRARLFPGRTPPSDARA